MLHLMKNLRLHNVDILEMFFKRLGVKQKHIAEKDDLENEILSNL